MIIRGKVLNDREIVTSRITIGPWYEHVEEMPDGTLKARDPNKVIEYRGTLKEFLEGTSEETKV